MPTLFKISYENNQDINEVPERVRTEIDKNNLVYIGAELVKWNLFYKPNQIVKIYNHKTEELMFSFYLKRHVFGNGENLLMTDNYKLEIEIIEQVKRSL